MRKSLTALMVAAGVAGAAASASATPVVFTGVFAIESVTTACGAATPGRYSFGATQTGSFLIRPANLGTNGTSSHFRIEVAGASGGYLSSFTLSGDSSSRAFQPVAALKIAFDEEPPILNYSAQMRLLKQTPSTLTDATKFVTMRVQIKNFSNIAGCTVTLAMTAMNMQF